MNKEEKAKMLYNTNNLGTPGDHKQKRNKKGRITRDITKTNKVVAGIIIAGLALIPATMIALMAFTSPILK